MLRSWAIRLAVLFIFITPLFSTETNESIGTEEEMVSNVTLHPFLNSIAFPSGFYNLSIFSSIVIMPEIKYNLILVDAIYGKEARSTLVPKLELSVLKLQRVIEIEDIIKESWKRDMDELNKAFYKKQLQTVGWTIGGFVVGVGITVGLYAIIQNSINVSITK